MSLVVEALKKAARLGDRSARSGQVLETAIAGGNKRGWWSKIGIMATLAAAAAAGVVLYGQPVRSPEPRAPIASSRPAQPVLSSPIADASPKTPGPSSAESETQAALTKGIGQLRDQHLAEARETFKEAVRLAPDSAEAHMALGLSLKRLKAYADAEAEYRTALRLDPGYPEAMNNLGLLLDLQGKTEEAISWYQKALGRKPGYHEAHLNLAIALERSGKAKEARDHYQAFLKSPPAALADVTRLVEQRLSAL
jgi:Flp pilus assembly protein TadD